MPDEAPRLQHGYIHALPIVGSIKERVDVATVEFKNLSSEPFSIGTLGLCGCIVL